MAILRGIDQLPEHFQAIGKTAVYHALLQHELAGGLQRCLNVTPSHAELLSSQLTFRKLLDVLASAAHDSIPNEALRADFLALLDRARSADEKRNGYIHSIWHVPLQLLFTGKAARSRLTVKPKQAPEYSTEVVDVDAVRALGNELHSLTDEFAYLWSRFPTSA